MKKLSLIILILISSHSWSAQELPIYRSVKADEENVAKLFEITRRINISNKLGMWKQDMMRNITLSCAISSNVITTKKNIIMPNETYSPVLRQEDLMFLNFMNIKVGSFIDMDKKYCAKIANIQPEELFKTCYIANIPAVGSIKQNTGYPREYLVVGSDFKDGSSIDVGVYCNAISNEPETKQFFATKGLARWANKPLYQKVQFSKWSENLMVGTISVEVDGIKENNFFTTIFK